MNQLSEINLMRFEERRCDQNGQMTKQDESVKFLMRKAGSSFDEAAYVNLMCGPFASTGRFPPFLGNKDKHLNSEEPIKLLASSSRKRQHSNSYEGKLLHMDKKRNLPEKLSNAAAVRLNTHSPTQHRYERRTNQHGFIPVLSHNRIPKVLTSREKVLKALRLFGMVFEELDKDKRAHQATSETHHNTWTILMRDGKQVHGKKRVGVVPGIEVGDEFEYKSQLKIIGLHFYKSGGIDYMNIGGLSVATSIVISKGAAYNDIFDYDVVIYCGAGAYLKSMTPKAIEDQKVTKGNLSLANSMREKYPVRVIIGRKKMGKRGKQYVYTGLYSVEQYRKEHGPLGNFVFKFKLQRLPGQAFIHFESLV